MRIWTDWKPDGESATLLRDALQDRHEILWGRSGAPVSDADVALGQPDPSVIIAAPRVRWVQVSSAGYTRFDRDDFWNAMKARGGAVTNSSGVFAEPCAQHLLAMIMSVARGLPWGLANQLGGKGWLPAATNDRSVLTCGQRVVIFGYGAIGHRLAELLAPLRMNITGVRRTIRGDENVPMATIDTADDLLPSADHVVNVLPLNRSTERFFGARRFGLMKAGAVFYNIGRGKSVDHDNVMSALASGRLAAAYLDVTDPEPLPADNPLWRAPNCFITPHTGGSHRSEPRRRVEHFMENLRRYERGEPLLDRVA